MKIHLDGFYSNNPDLIFEDVITGIDAGVAESGIVHIRLHTKDKYVRISTDGFVSCGDYKGQIISISPYLYDKEGNDLYNSDFEEYLNHPDKYTIELAVETGLSCPTSVSTALKHEYWINYIPHELAFDYNVIKPVELIEWVD